MKKIGYYLRGVSCLRIFFLAAGILLTYKILFDFDFTIVNQITRVISPFLAGLIIAYCLNIPCFWLENKLLCVKARCIRRIAKPVSILIVYSVIALLTIVTIGTFVPMIYDNTVQFATSLPAYLEEAVIFLKSIPSVGIFEFDLWIDSLVEAKPWNALLSYFNTFSLQSSFQYVTNFFSGLFSTLLALISSVYFLLEFQRIKVFIKRIIGLIPSDRKRNLAMKYISLVDIGFRKFITCQLLDSLVIGTLSTIEFAILKSPYALLLGFMLAVANIVPYFGSIIGTILAVVIMGFTNGIETALLSAIILLITQQLDANFIQPKIIGTSFSISPILIIIGITVGGSLGGIAGMIFAIPVVNVIKTGLEEYMQKREPPDSHVQTEVTSLSDRGKGNA